jgi:hypothetical protein
LFHFSGVVIEVLDVSFTDFTLSGAACFFGFSIVRSPFADVPKSTSPHTEGFASRHAIIIFTDL